MTRIPASERDDGRARLEYEPAVRKREADGVEELEEPLREQEAEEEADDRRETPTTSASTITEPRTCRFVAPIVRSVANSRVRCAIVIESEFAITNAADEERDAAEGEQESAQEEMKSFVSAASSCRLLLARSHLRALREDRLDLARRAASAHARLRGDRDLVELAGFFEQPLRRGRSKPRAWRRRS